MRTARDPPDLHTHDYRAAFAKAVEWLGDRYLLAKPINVHSARPAAAGRWRFTHSQRHASGA